MGISINNSLTSFLRSAGPVYGVDQVAQAGQNEESRSAGVAAQQPTQEAKPDQVTFSDEALRRAGIIKGDNQKTGGPMDSVDKKKDSKADIQNNPELEHLKNRDHEVRVHEQAHIMAGGSLVRGGASFGYKVGPDGNLYAVSGEVSIDTSPIPDDPEATARKMAQVSKAALAPAQPSGQDRAVASAAMSMQAEAQQQATQLRLQKLRGGGTSSSGASQAQTGAHVNIRA